MSRRWRTAAAVVVVVGLAAAACGGSDNARSHSAAAGGAPSASRAAGAPVLGGAMPPSIGAGEGRLNLVVRPGYAEDGTTDPNHDWVGPFRQETGCQVTSTAAATGDEMVQLMHTGQYDGVSASGNASTRLILAGDAAPVNVDLVKDYAELSAFLKDQPYNTYDGTHYGIPQGWAANVLMWRPDIVTPAPDSWAVVFDPASPSRGKVTAYDDPISIADAALYLETTRPDLKITDPYELTDDQFTAAVDLLKVQRTLIGHYWNDATKLISASGAGAAVLGSSWQQIANRINGDTRNPAVDAIVPKEGSTGWSDTWMVYAKARNPNCMYLWLDYITRPEVQAQVATSFGEAPANPKACDVIAKTDARFCDSFHATDEAFYHSIAFWKVPLPDCGDPRGATCKGYDAWVQAWQSITG